MPNTENNYTETDLGNISLNPRGEYDSSAAYEYLDTVSYQGGSYFCLAELETTITGIAPDAGRNSEHWQMIAAPGDMTPEYTAAYNDVINKVVQVETSRAAVELAQQEIEAVQTDVQQLHSDTVQAAQEAENSKNSAANSAQSAEQSRKTVSESEQNINGQIAGFDSRVSEAVEQSKEEINTAKQQAVDTITNQQNTSVNAVKTEGEKIITRVENDAKTVADDRSTVEEAAQTVLNNAQEVAQNTQTVASNTENAAASAESAKTSADNATQSAKSVEDASKQIEQNKKDVASLKEGLGEITEEYSKDITGEIEWINGKWHAASNIQDERGHKGAYIPVNVGEKYTITGDLFNLQDLYGLYDSDKKRVSYYPNPYTQHIPFEKMSATITIPSGVAYIFVSTVVKNSDGMGLVEDFSLFKNGILRAKAEAVASEAKAVASEAKAVASEAIPKVAKYPNLLDWTNSEVGQLNNQGVLNSSATTLTTTDYIPVEAGRNIYQSRAGAKYVYVHNPVTFYDSNKQFISPVIYGGTEYTTVPSNAKYMRVSVLNTNISMGVQMEYDKVTEYHEAGSYDIIAKIENDIQSKSSISNVDFEDNIIHERIIDNKLKNDFSWGTIDGLYATITFDDTNTDIDILEDLAEELNIPFCFATIPSYLSRTMSKGTEMALQTLQRAVANGGEVLSHWQMPLTSASTESDYYEVYAGAKRTLENAGFKVNGLITAGGYNNGLEFKTQDFDKSTRYGRIYYQYGDLTAFNNHNVEQFFNERTFTDSGVTDMKSKIDAMATQGYGWLNMASHGTPTGNASNTLTISDFREIFQYAKDKGFTFITWGKMYDKFKSSKLEKRIKEENVAAMDAANAAMDIAIKSYVTPELRNGSMGNPGNQNAIGMKYALPINGAKSVTVIPTFALTDGYYFHWTMWALSKSGEYTVNDRLKEYDPFIRTRNETVTFDFSAFPEGSLGFAFCLFERNEASEYVVHRIEKDGKHAFKVIYNYENYALDAEHKELAQEVESLKKDIGSSMAKFNYIGESVGLKKHGVNVKLLYGADFSFTDGYNIGSSQGFDICKNKIFQAFNQDHMLILDFSTGKKIAETYPTIQHGDCVEFSDEFYDSGDNYPLLYATSDTTPMLVYVNRINNDYVSTLIKTYKFPQEKTGYYGGHCTDFYRNIIYTIGYKENSYATNNGSNGMIVCAWDLKEVATNDDGTLTPSLIRTFDLPFIITVQGQKVLNGNLFLVSSHWADTNTIIYVVDPDKERIISAFKEFPSEIKNNETEDISFVESEKGYDMIIFTRYGNEYFKLTEI